MTLFSALKHFLSGKGNQEKAAQLHRRLTGLGLRQTLAIPNKWPGKGIPKQVEATDFLQ